jgi:hypothetical protein
MRIVRKGKKWQLFTDDGQLIFWGYANRGVELEKRMTAALQKLAPEPGRSISIDVTLSQVKQAMKEARVPLEGQGGSRRRTLLQLLWTSSTEEEFISRLKRGGLA